MAKLYTDTDKFGDANASPTVEAFHAAVKDIVRQKLAESGGHWDSFVFDKSYTLITEEDMKGVEKMLLDAGHLTWNDAEAAVVGSGVDEVEHEEHLRREGGHGLRVRGAALQPARPIAMPVERVALARLAQDVAVAVLGARAADLRHRLDRRRAG